MYFITPLFVYPVLAALLPVVFYFFKPKYAWLSIPCAVVIEVILFWLEFSYYESRGLMILLTVVQILIMALVLFVVKQAAKRIRNK